MEGRRILAEYFKFSRKERIGVIALLLLILAVAFLPQLVPGFEAPPLTPADSEWIAAMNRLDQQEREDSARQRQERPRYSDLQFDRREGQRQAARHIETFPFDPNILEEDGWKRLGVPERTIRTIKNYLARGGRFRRPQDLGRIYGLDSPTFRRLAPFIRIAGGESESQGGPGQGQASQTRRPGVFKPVDVNEADTAAFIALPGIGSRLASRIVAFREKLGGFYEVEQLREVYGIADSLFEKLKPHLRLENVETRKININLAEIDVLKAHPYIRYPLARAIIQYREQHGSFGQLEDLKRIMAISDEVYGKILPYLSTGE